MAGSVTVATKSYNNKVVVYKNRHVSLIMTRVHKSCDKRQPLPIFMVPSIKEFLFCFCCFVLFCFFIFFIMNTLFNFNIKPPKKYIYIWDMLGKESCPLVRVAMTPQEAFLSGKGSVRVSALTLINEQVICHTSATRGK